MASSEAVMTRHRRASTDTQPHPMSQQARAEEIATMILSAGMKAIPTPSPGLHAQIGKALGNGTYSSFLHPTRSLRVYVTNDFLDNYLEDAS